MSSSSSPTREEIDAIEARLDKLEGKELEDAYEEFRKKYPKVYGTSPAGCGPNPDPENEHVKEGGWGGDTASAKTWDAVPMKDDPSLWKIVDQEGKNIAHKFESEEEAEKYIKYHRCVQEGGDIPDEPGPIEPEPEPEPEPIPGTGETPYPIKGEPMNSVKKGPLVRHYRSDKPDDFTIEMNTKSIKFQNYQCIVDITNDCEWAHDDNFSIKLGGRHMNGGWFDNSLSVYSGKTGLGTEKKHPSTQLFVVKGPSVGDTRGKRFQYACTYFTGSNKTELWTNMNGDGWKKQVEGTDVGGFNPGTPEDEFQLRIDGFKDKDKPPTIHSAIVAEI